MCGAKIYYTCMAYIYIDVYVFAGVSGVNEILNATKLQRILGVNLPGLRSWCESSVFSKRVRTRFASPNMTPPPSSRGKTSSNSFCDPGPGPGCSPPRPDMTRPPSSPFKTSSNSFCEPDHDPPAQLQPIIRPGTLPPPPPLPHPPSVFFGGDVS